MITFDGDKCLFDADDDDSKYLVAKDTRKDGDVVGLIEHILC